MANWTDHEIVAVSSNPYRRWIPAAGKSFGAKRTELDWSDPVSGGADPFIGVNSRQEIFVTTASIPKAHPMMLKSSDGGESWTRFKLPLEAPSQTSWGIQSFSILSDDTFLLAFASEAGYHVARSHDSGRTWQSPASIDSSPYPFAGGTTHGFMHQLADGTVLLPISCYGDDLASVMYIYRSADGGRTWGDRSRVCFWAWEASLLRLATGRLLIAVRYQRGENCVLPSDPPDLSELYVSGYPKRVYVAGSDDEGRTWQNWTKVTGGVFDVPGELVQLSDGTLVLLYAHRAPDPPPCGTWAAASHDEGRSWQPGRYIVNSVCHHDNPHDWGFSASTVLQDDVILTLSGCRGRGWPGNASLNAKAPGKLHAIRWRVQ